MKNAKRLVSLLVAVMLIASIGAAALAAPAPTTYTITLNGTTTEQNFKAVKVFDLTYDDTVTPMAASYSIADPWTEFFKHGADGAAYIVAANNAAGTLNPIVVEKSLLTGAATDTEMVTAYINITEANVVAFAEAARTWVETSGETFTVKTAAGAADETVINVEEPGYWMVYEISGAMTPAPGQVTTVMLTNTTPTAEVDIKGVNTPPVKIPGEEMIIDEHGVTIGTVIPYEVHAKLASSEGHAWHYQVFEDAMSDGLTFNHNSTNNITVKVGTQTLTIGTAANSQIRIVSDLSNNTQFGTFGAIKYNTNGFSLYLNTKALNDSTNPVFAAGAKILITYTATVNSDAADLESNTLSYGNGGSYDEFVPIPTTPVDEVETWVNSITVDKIIGGVAANKLEGVGFKLVRKSVKGLKITTATQSYSALNPLTAASEIAAGDTVYQIVGKGRLIDANNVCTEYYKIKVGNAEVYVPVASAANYEMGEFALAQEEFCKLTFATAGDPTTPVTKVEWTTNAAQGTELSTDSTGALTFPGLADGTYYLRETTTPAGYNGLTGDVEVVLNHTVSNNQIVPANETEQISNNKGGLLPGTGGIGTTIFYVLGGILLVGASVLLVTRRRVSSMN